MDRTRDSENKGSVTPRHPGALHFGLSGIEVGRGGGGGVAPSGGGRAAERARGAGRAGAGAGCGMAAVEFGPGFAALVERLEGEARRWREALAETDARLALGHGLGESSRLTGGTAGVPDLGLRSSTVWPLPSAEDFGEGEEIFLACLEGDFEACAGIVRSNPSAASMTNADGYSPLHFAAQKGYWCAPPPLAPPPTVRARPLGPARRRNSSAPQGRRGWRV